MSGEQQQSHGAPEGTENKPKDPLAGTKLGFAGSRIPRKPHNYRPPGAESIITASNVQPAKPEHEKKEED